MNVEQGIQLSDLFGIARRRAKAVVVTAGLVMLAIYWIAMALPNEYMSYSTILVEPQSIDPTIANSGVESTDLGRRLGIMTAEILSRSRLNKIIDEFDLYADESEYLQRAEVIDLMREDVRVEPVISELETGRTRRDLEFNTFKITYRSEDPVTAMNVANSIADDFIDANINARTEVTQKALDFMRDQMENLVEEIARVEASITVIKAENPGSLPEDLATNQRLYESVGRDLRSAERALDVARSDAAFWKNQVLTVIGLGAPEDRTSPAYRRSQLELELAALRARGFTDKHPDVIRSLAEIEALGEAGLSDDEEPQNAAAVQAKAEQQRAEMRAQAAKEEVDRLRIAATEIEARINKTPPVAEKLDALERQYDQMRVSYQDFSDKLKQAQVQANLERRQLGERFRILETAFKAARPSSPNRILLLLLGAVIATGLGVCVGGLAEASDRSLHQPSSLQTLTGIPVLASIPEIMLESDRAARTRKMVREALAAAAVVAFCIIGGAATYVFVNGWPWGGGAPAERSAEGARAGAWMIPTPHGDRVIG